MGNIHRGIVVLIKGKKKSNCSGVKKKNNKKNLCGATKYRRGQTWGSTLYSDFMLKNSKMKGGKCPTPW